MANSENVLGKMLGKYLGKHYDLWNNVLVLLIITT